MTHLTKRDLDKLTGSQIKDLAKRGIVRIMTSLPTPVTKLCFTDLPEYKKHAKDKGKPITINEAARQFKIPPPTITRWVKRLKIPIVRRTKRELYIDRAVIAYCAEIYAQRGGQGRRLFNANLTPYVQGTPRSRAA